MNSQYQNTQGIDKSKMYFMNKQYSLAEDECKRICATSENELDRMRSKLLLGEIYKRSDNNLEAIKVYYDLLQYYSIADDMNNICRMLIYLGELERDIEKLQSAIHMYDSLENFKVPKNDIYKLILRVAYETGNYKALFNNLHMLNKEERYKFYRSYKL